MAWQSLSLPEREREYSPSSCVGGDYEPYLRACAEISDFARRAHPPATYRYGPKPAQMLDLFLPSAGREPSPILVFIHGGYWQELGKDVSCFPALGCLSRDIAFAAVGYTLAPAASVSDMVEECRSALDWLRSYGAAVGVDVDRIVVAGSSAGAHLAATSLLSGPQFRRAGTGAPIKGAVLISGIYDLGPLVGTSINNALGLDAGSAAEVSPMSFDLTAFPPALVCWGEVETSEAKRQSRAFAQALTRVGTPCETLEAEARNHFDVVLDLVDAASPLGRGTLSLIEQSRR